MFVSFVILEQHDRGSENFETQKEDCEAHNSGCWKVQTAWYLCPGQGLPLRHSMVEKQTGKWACAQKSHKISKEARVQGGDKFALFFF